MTNLKLLVLISSPECENKYKRICKKFNLYLNILINAKGTATSGILNYFGLVETSRKIAISVIPEYLEQQVLKEVNQKMKLEGVGTGIAFTVSLTSANKFLLDSYKEIQKENDTMNETKYHLIITIVLEGYLEQVMNAAKKAGAQGGTVIRGRGLGNKEAKKIFGFEIEPGRDLVLNIVEDSIKNKVMEEITKTAGIKTASKGVCISLPVDNAIGIVNASDNS